MEPAVSTMRVLITNDSLENRGGAEVFTQDLGKALQARGHQVVVFSCGRVRGKRLMDIDPIPVVTDLVNLEMKPDIIHGNNHLDLMTALMSLPGVPAVHHVHGAVCRGVPPLHPRIHRYFTITPTMKDRLMAEYNLPGKDIDVVFNGVDLRRFRTVRGATEKPKRALVFHRSFKENGETTDVIRRACERLGISLEVIGRRSGKTILNPEKVLLEYDLVFAAGMSAIEAAASGCAVIVLGKTSAGPMLDLENFDRFRKANFSLPLNYPPPDQSAVESEILKYSAEGLSAVTEVVREKADFNVVVDEIVAHYEDVIQRQSHQEEDLQAEMQSLAEYLHVILPLIKRADDMLFSDAGMPQTMADALGELEVQMARVQEEMRRALQK